MKEIVDFIVNYWQYISVVLVIVLEIIMMILKKRSIISDNSIISDIIPLILQAESIKDSGVDRLRFVLEHFPFEKHPGVDRKVVSTLVEYVLMTPTKKGGFGREEDV